MVGAFIAGAAALLVGAYLAGAFRVAEELLKVAQNTPALNQPRFSGWTPSQARLRFLPWYCRQSPGSASAFSCLVSLQAWRRNRFFVSVGRAIAKPDRLLRLEIVMEIGEHLFGFAARGDTRCL